MKEKRRVLHLSEIHQQAKRAFNLYISMWEIRALPYKANKSRLILETPEEIVYFRTTEDGDRVRGMRFNEVIIDEAIEDPERFMNDAQRYVCFEIPCDHQYVDHPSLPQENCRVCGETKPDFATTDLRAAGNHIQGMGICGRCENQGLLCEHGFCSWCQCKHWCWID